MTSSCLTATGWKNTHSIINLGREGGRERGREGGREGGRERRREGGREREKESIDRKGGKEGGKNYEKLRLKESEQLFLYLSRSGVETSFRQTSTRLGDGRRYFLLRSNTRSKETHFLLIT